MNAPRRWPHILLEAGPSIAGVEAGDMLPFDSSNVVYFWANSWSPFTNMQRGPVSRPALAVSVASRVNADGRAFRFIDDPPRVLRNDAAQRSEQWMEEPLDVQVNVSKWRLRFVFDGPPLATVRHFGPYIACRPALVGAALNGTVARSTWLVANDGARETLVVDQSFDGAITWRAMPRLGGKSLADVAAALPNETKTLDKELAAGIVAQISDIENAPHIIGYDGVVRSHEPFGARNPGVRARVYRMLTRGEAVQWQHSDEEMAAELAETTPASIEQLRAMMHGLFADAAAREAAIVEECAVLAG